MTEALRSLGIQRGFLNEGLREPGVNAVDNKHIILATFNRELTDSEFRRVTRAIYKEFGMDKELLIRKLNSAVKITIEYYDGEPLTEELRIPEDVEVIVDALEAV